LKKFDVTNPISRILIVQTAFIGDVILTLPVLQTLKNNYPSANIDFLCIPSSRNILETHEHLSNLIIYDKHKKERGLSYLHQLISSLRSSKYDLAIVPHRSFRSAYMVWRAGIPLRIGFDTSAGKYLFNKRVVYQKKLHEIERNLKLLDALDISTSGKMFPQISFTDEDHNIVNKWCESVGIYPDSKLIALAPGQTANELLNHSFKIVLIGGNQDQWIGRIMEESIAGKIINAIGKFTLRQSALILKKCQLLITNDSAPQHLAINVKTPVITIYGPTVPEFGFFPYGANDKVIEVKNLACRPCSLHGGPKCPIGTFECMKNIYPNDVIMTAFQILDSMVVRDKQ
jgi:heptosyltransferase-2